MPNTQSSQLVDVERSTKLLRTKTETLSHSLSCKYDTVICCNHAKYAHCAAIYYCRIKEESNHTLLVQFFFHFIFEGRADTDITDFLDLTANTEFAAWSRNEACNSINCEWK